MNKQLLTETMQKENTVVLFYADWCGGCKVAMPMVEEIADKLKFKLIKIDQKRNQSCIHTYRNDGLQRKFPL